MIELFLIVALILLVPCVAVSGWIGATYGRNDIKKQAVQAGVAEWIVDDEGIVEFRWKAKGE